MSRSARPRIACFAGIALFLGCGGRAHAQRYVFKHYTQETGLTNLSVNTMTQDKAGYIWPVQITVYSGTTVVNLNISGASRVCSAPMWHL